MRTSLVPFAWSGGTPGRCGPPGYRSLVQLAVGVAMAAGSVCAAKAQVPATLNGAPVQVQPFYSEPGIPTVTIPIGTPNPFGAADSTSTADTSTSGSTGTTGTAGTTGIDTGTGSGTTVSVTSSADPLTTLLGTTDGSTIIANAQALGVNPSAVAATCVLENGCQNAAATASGAQGMFQMYPAAYNEGLQTALAANPDLASQVVQGAAGMTDPTTEAIAASGYLIQAAQTLESAGIANPTVLQVRGYYNFGPSNGVALASASPDETMAQAMPNVPQSILTKNGVVPGETVGQWETAVSAKIGNAANQSVFS